MSVIYFLLVQYKVIQEFEPSIKFRHCSQFKCVSESRYIGFFAVSGQVEARSSDLIAKRYATQN